MSDGAVSPPAPPEAPVYRTLEEACSYLEACGYHCSVYKLSRDVKHRHKVVRQGDGSFTKKALDAYQAHLKPLAGETRGGKLERMANEKAANDNRISAARASRLEMELERESGRLVEAEKTWQAWAASAQLLKSRCENWTHEVSARLLDHLGVPDTGAGELQLWLWGELEEFFDQFAERRQWAVVLEKSRTSAEDVE